MFLKKIILKIRILVLFFSISLFPIFLKSGMPRGGAGPLDFDFANDPEFAKMMEEFERELANLSPEERQQFDEMVNEFQRVLEEMPEEDFDKLLTDINNDIAAGQKPESAAPAAEIMPTIPTAVEIPAEIKTLAEVIQAIKTNLIMLLTKIQIAPELLMKINKWILQGKITGVPAMYNWDQLKTDLEKFISLLSNLLATNKKMKPVFLFSIHENQALEQALIQFSAEILEVSSIEIVEFGLKQTKYTNQLIINILGLFCELVFGKNVMTDLNAIYQKHISEIAGAKKEEKIPALPKETFSTTPSLPSFDQSSYGGGSGDFFNEPYGGGGYSDYGNYPSYGGYDSYGDYAKEKEEKGQHGGGRGGTSGGGGKTEKGEDKKEEELKDKSSEIFKEIEKAQSDLDGALTKLISTINSSELSQFVSKSSYDKSTADEENLSEEKTESVSTKLAPDKREEEIPQKEIERAPEEQPIKEKEKKAETTQLTEEQKKLIETVDKTLQITPEQIEEWTEESYENFVQYVDGLLEKLDPIALPEVQNKILQLREKFTEKSAEEKNVEKEQIEEKIPVSKEFSSVKTMADKSADKPVIISPETAERASKQVDTVKTKADSLNKAVNKITVKKTKEDTQQKIATDIQYDVAKVDSVLEGLKKQSAFAKASSYVKTSADEMADKSADDIISSLIDKFSKAMKALDPFLTKKMKEKKQEKDKSPDKKGDEKKLPQKVK